MSETMSPEEIQELIDLLDKPTNREAAEHLGVTRQTLTAWKTKGCPTTTASARLRRLLQELRADKGNNAA